MIIIKHTCHLFVMMLSSRSYLHIKELIRISKESNSHFKTNSRARSCLAPNFVFRGVVFDPFAFFILLFCYSCHSISVSCQSISLTCTLTHSFTAVRLHSLCVSTLSLCLYITHHGNSRLNIAPEKVEQVIFNTLEYGTYGCHITDIP